MFYTRAAKSTLYPNMHIRRRRYIPRGVAFVLLAIKSCINWRQSSFISRCVWESDFSDIYIYIRQSHVITTSYMRFCETSRKISRERPRIDENVIYTAILNVDPFDIIIRSVSNVLWNVRINDTISRINAVKARVISFCEIPLRALGI